MANQEPVARWRIILSFVLDLFTAFWALGLLVGWLFGGPTGNGFSLSGGPALLLFALIVAYFFIGKRVGGTLWQRILGATP